MYPIAGTYPDQLFGYNGISIPDLYGVQARHIVCGGLCGVLLSNISGKETCDFCYNVEAYGVLGINQTAVCDNPCCENRDLGIRGFGANNPNLARQLVLPRL